MSGTNTVTYLKDYKQPDYWIKHVDLEFDLQDGETIVTAKLQIEKNGQHQNPLTLDGEELELLGVKMDASRVRQFRIPTPFISLKLLLPSLQREFCSSPARPGWSGRRSAGTGPS